MLSHETIWSAIDTLAERHQLTPSALAKRAGLDPTSFNKSKRFGPDGRKRWPSTESVSKVLEATGASVDQFFGYAFGRRRRDLPVRKVPSPARFRSGRFRRFFDDGGFPAGQGWDVVEFPSSPERKQESTRWKCRERA